PPLALVFKPAADPVTRERAARVLVATGAAGLAAIAAIGVSIDINGWTWKPLALVFGDLSGRQPGLGYGAAFVAAAALVFLCHGLALTGWVKGDTFVAGAIGASIALVGGFTIYPLGRLFVNAFLDSSGHLSLASLIARLVSSWIYGLPGVGLAQTLALTPVAFLVLVGVAEGISASLEEAARTLRASPMQTFTTITLPLMAPGIANAFLIVFIESLADFGNPLLLGGNLEVLSTAIYFAVVGVQQDPGRASVLAVILLAFSLGLFLVQRRLLSRRSFVTVGGKGDGGMRTPLPRAIVALAAGLALPWAALAVVIYLMILTGGFFEKWGLNHALTLR